MVESHWGTHTPDKNTFTERVINQMAVEGTALILDLNFSIVYIVN